MMLATIGAVIAYVLLSYIVREWKLKNHKK